MLWLSDTQLDDAGLAELAQVSSVRRVSLAETSISASGLEALWKLPSLEYVDVSGCNLTEAEAAAFRRGYHNKELMVDHGRTVRRGPSRR
jgi:hypothetical protein